MAFRQIPFVEDEHYHCFTRGIDKRITFEDERDYERFIEALYLCNDTHSIRRDNLAYQDHAAILQSPRGEPLVAILAYCLMPNHFHLVLREIVENGISRFMQKLGTAYTMYFNTKQERIGSLFIKPFRAKHIDDDDYLKRVVNYVHLNPAELFEPGWKDGVVGNMAFLEGKLRSYRFSSLPDYAGEKRSAGAILDRDMIKSLFDETLDLPALLGEAAEYYATLRW